MSLARSPATVDYHVTLDRPFVDGTAPVRRGPVRLVIDMPARSAPYVAIAIGAALFMSAIFALEAIGLQAVTPPSLPPPVFPLPAVVIGVGALTLALALMTLGAIAKREILEIDSRFVSVARGKQTMAVFPRGWCDTFDLSDSSDNAGQRLATGSYGHPWLLFGANGEWHLRAGGYISRESAEHLAPTIRAFMEEHPCEPGFDSRFKAVRS